MYRSKWRFGYLISVCFLLLGVTSGVGAEALTNPQSSKDTSNVAPKMWTAIGAQNKVEVLLPLSLVAAEPERHRDNPSGFTRANVAREFAGTLCAYRVGSATFVAPRQWKVTNYATLSNGSTTLSLTNPFDLDEKVSFVIGRASDLSTDALVSKLFPDESSVKQSQPDAVGSEYSVVELRSNLKGFSKTLQNGWIQSGLVEVEWDGVYGIVTTTMPPSKTGLASAILHDFVNRYPSLSQFAKS